MELVLLINGDMNNISKVPFHAKAIKICSE